MKLWILRDRRNPERIELATAIREVGDYVEADILPWRVARQTLDPETYAYVCRQTFTDWCARRGL